MREAEARKAEEDKRRAEIQQQIEAQRREQERIQAEIQNKEKLAQEEARKLTEALRKSEVRTEAKRSAMSDAKFIALCKLGDARKVEEAIRNGANVNAKEKSGWTALMFAKDRGHTQTANFLRKYSAEY